MKNSWFKHYNSAHEGQTIAELWGENDTELIAFYWTILEMVSKYEDPEKRGFWRGNLSLFWIKLRMKKQRSAKLLTKCAQRFNLALSFQSDSTFELYLPNFLELQENRGGKREAKNEQKAPRGEKREERREKKEIRSVREHNLVPSLTVLPTTENPSNPVTEIRDAFCEAYRKEFKRAYTGWGSKENSQTKTWLKSISLEKAKELCQLFPKWNDPWVTKRGHPFGVLVSQYVQVDAWANSHKILVDKIAKGTAIETVELKNAIIEGESAHAIKQYSEQRNKNFSGRGVKELQDETEPELSRPRISLF